MPGTGVRPIFCWSRLEPVLASLVIFALVACGEVAGDGAETRARRWEPVELELDLVAEAGNPFDPAEISVVVETVAPKGRRDSVVAFVTRDFQRELRDGHESRTIDTGLRWAARLLPDEVGTWRWRWRSEASGRTALGTWHELRVGSPAAAAHGIARLRPAATALGPRDEGGSEAGTASPQRPSFPGRYLAFDDGTPFVPIGENMAWPDARGTYAYEAWLDRLVAHGGNYIRLWMPSWAFGLEWIERDHRGAVARTTLGNYEQRLDRAWQLDFVIEAARKRGVQVMLSIQNHGAFSLTTNSEWADNPYNVRNGGPLERPRDFFTDPTARELFARRLRYIVARWGASPNVFAWELWNEVDQVEQPTRAELVAWHRDMARLIEALDPHDRLISTSTGGLESALEAAGVDGPLAELWALPEIGFVQGHLYGMGRDLPADFPAVLPRLVRRLARFGKPVLIAEAGTDYRGPAETLRADPDGDGFHDVLWAGLFGGGFGTGMAWWWDLVRDPDDQYFHFAPLAELIRGVDFPAQEFAVSEQEASSPGGRALRALSLRGEKVALVWIDDIGHRWSAPDPAHVVDAMLSHDALAPGRWRFAWLDTRTGVWLGHGEQQVGQDGRITLAVPPFRKDVALRLDHATR